MASRRNYLQSQLQYSTATTAFDRRFEFQESDIWNSPDDDDLGDLISPSSPEPHQAAPAIPAARPRNRSARRPVVSSSSSSLPVNVPDWSKILGGQWRGDEVVVSDEEDVEERVPPHEYAARQVARRSNTVVAFSVQEGVGRTLKGRDLRRVRNAIWKQTGFED